jgi:DNA (cytosine-5)-methyltransferase 1
MPDKKKTKSSSQRKGPIMLSVFTGTGGLDLGLEAAGFQSIGHIEQCENCRHTLIQNRPKWTELPWSDVHKANTPKLISTLGLKKGELDLLAGAPPCQPFSTAGQWSPKARLGMEDKRADTLSAFLGIAEKLLPKTILIENVPTFWNESFGARQKIEDFFKRINTEHQAGYTFCVKILNSADFGVPQIRKRLILVATRTNQEFTWPIARYANKHFTAWDAIGHLNDTQLPTAKGKWANLLPSIPRSVEAENSLAIELDSGHSCSNCPAKDLHGP